MKVNWLLQKNVEDDNTFEKVLKRITKQEIKKIYLVIACMKDTGYKVIEEELYGFKNSTKVLLGIDKKNTTKVMLEGMLKLVKDVYLYSNNQDKEIDSNIYVFETANKVYVYNISGNLSEGGISSNISMYPEIIYDLTDKNDKEAYKEMKNMIEKQLISEETIKLTKEYIDELISKKEIFSTSMYNNYAIKSISELLKDSENKNKDTKENEVEKDEIYNEEKPNLKADIKKIDFSKDFDIDVDISVEESIDEEPVKKQTNKNKKKVIEEKIDVSEVKETKISNEKLEAFTEMDDEELEDESIDIFKDGEAADLESLIFSKPSIKIENTVNVKEENKEEEFKEEKITLEGSEGEIKVKKIDLNKVTNLIMQLPKKATKGKDKDAIKVPAYIRDMIPHFFSLSDKGRNIELADGKYKIKDITFEIVNVETGDKYQDDKAKIMQKQGQTYITLNSETLDKVEYVEEDIARIIKLSDEIYRCEIISKNSKEYNLWLRLCSQNFKSTERKYGVM